MNNNCYIVHRFIVRFNQCLQIHTLIFVTRDFFDWELCRQNFFKTAAVNIYANGLTLAMRGLGGVVGFMPLALAAAVRVPYTASPCSDLGQVVNLSLSVD